MRKQKITRKSFLKYSLSFGLSLLLFKCENSNSKEKNKNKRIIIIGAGMSGIAAGFYLMSEGFDVIILEARDRLGGRIWSYRELGSTVDLGASWIHGHKGNPLTDIVEEFGIKTKITDFEDIQAVYDYQGKAISEKVLLQSEERFSDIFEELEALAEEIDHDISFEEALLYLFKKYKISQEEKQIYQSLMLGIETESASDLSRFSLWYANSGDDFSGNDLLFPEGYDQIIKHLAKGLKILTNQVVKIIRYNTQKVQVITEKQTFEGDALICTLPLGVLKTQKVKFIPKLPEYKQKAIEHLGVGTLNKIAMKFKTHNWPIKRQFLMFIPPLDSFKKEPLTVKSDCMNCHKHLNNVEFVKKKGGYTEFLNLHYYGLDKILVSLTGGPTAWRLETKANEEIIQEVINLLNSPKEIQLPYPEKFIITRWMSDPFSCGSYSYIKVGSKPEDLEALAQPLNKRLFFAGEATHKDYNATVHGAFLSGIREAENILNLFS